MGLQRGEGSTLSELPNVEESRMTSGSLMYVPGRMVKSFTSGINYSQTFQWELPLRASFPQQGGGGI
jgi:hypothetical protein